MIRGAGRFLGRSKVIASTAMAALIEAAHAPRFGRPVAGTPELATGVVRLVAAGRPAMP